jgi:hypothetical protein
VTSAGCAAHTAARQGRNESRYRNKYNSEMFIHHASQN